MEARVAVISIIVEKTDSIDQLNAILHEYGFCILGRMGIPYRKRNLNIISIAVEATQDIINSLAGKVGRIPGVTAKTAYSNNSFPCD